MPSAKTLPERIRLAAFTMSSGVTWLSVPIWSSLPQRPQFLSFCVASAIACLPTLIFIKLFLPLFSLLQRAPRRWMPAPVAILRWAPVFQQAGCGVAALTNRHCLRMIRPTRIVQKSAIQEDIHETQSDRCRRNDGRADAARAGGQHRR